MKTLREYGPLVIATCALALVIWRTQPVPAAAPPKAISPLAAFLVGQRTDALRLAAFYRAFAEVLDRERDLIRDTSQLRQAHGRAGKLLFEQELAGKYPGLAAAIDRLLQARLGLEVRSLTPEVRSQAVAAFSEIAASCEEVR